MSALSPLENSLNDLIVSKGPVLPKKAKNIIVQYLPYLALLLGLSNIIRWWALWTWGHVGSTEVNFAHEYARTYHTELYVPSRMSPMVWTGLMFIGLQIVLYYASFFPLGARKKTGWDLLFYAGIAGLAYSFFLLIINQDIEPFLKSTVGIAAGFYFLFQIRSHYTEHGINQSKTTK